MEKIIFIGEKEIPLRSNAMNLIIYQNEFNEDMLVNREKLLGPINSEGEIKIRDIDSIATLRQIWTFAKTANRDLPGFEAWAETIDTNDVTGLYTTCIDLFINNLNTRSDIKNV